MERWTEVEVSSDEHSIIPFLGTHIHVLLGLPRPTPPLHSIRSTLNARFCSRPRYQRPPTALGRHRPHRCGQSDNKTVSSTFLLDLICNGCYRITARKTNRKEIVRIYNARSERIVREARATIGIEEFEQNFGKETIIPLEISFV